MKCAETSSAIGADLSYRSRSTAKVLSANGHFHNQLGYHAATCAKTRAERPNLYYGIKHPKTGELIFPSETRVWGYDEKRHEQQVKENVIWWGKNQEKDKPRLKSFLRKVGTGLVPDTLWLRSDSGDNQDAKREMMALNPKDVFPTPKPERLMAKILQIATKSGDLVLDSFAGSGTTGAVAHKMGRRWIMVELGQHCETHIVPRLHRVIDGEDGGGITKDVEWNGGGGFRYYRLAPSLLRRDAWDNWVISKEYDATKVAQAVCKLMGFVYQPDETRYWMQGRSSETDFIYVTTQSLTHEQLAAISEEVGDERTLLVCCKAFRAEPDAFPNLTIRKIPQTVLRKCEWGRDDYSLKVANLPEMPRGPDEPDRPRAANPAAQNKGRKSATQDDLFGGEGGK